MNTKIIILFALFGYQTCVSQVLKFIVKDAKTDLPVEGVQVFSHEMHDKVVYSSKKGVVKFDVRKTDTLVFFKKNFTPFYLQISHNKFDTLNHVIHLKMTEDNRTSENRLPMKFNELGREEYEFELDSLNNHEVKRLDDNQIKISRFEMPDSDPTKDRSFHFVEIKLDEKSKMRSGYTRK